MALIRCKKCGNLASSRSSACPICGEPIAAPESATTNTQSAPQSTAPVSEPAPTPAPTPQSTAPVVEPTPAPVVETPKQESAAQQPKTLNDILAERSAAPKTVHDTLSQGGAAEVPTQPAESNNVVVPTPASAPMTEPISGVSHYDYDDDVRSVEEYEADIRRHKRVSFALMISCGILLLLMCGAVAWGFLEREDKYMLEDEIAKAVADIDIYKEMESDQVSLLRSNAEDLVNELAKYKDQNDTMEMRYNEALEMMAQLESEKNYTLEQLKRYQNEVQTLKNIMKQYVRQIDSLNNVNKSLVTENKQYKKEISSANLRADQAEENANELNAKVRQGSVIQVSGIKVLCLNANSKEVKRIKQAKRLRVDFELTANALAEPGEKSVYICITNPDGYALSASVPIMFNFEGKEMMASAVRKVDYENNSVPVSIFYDGESFGKGTYAVDIYIDGRHCGSTEKYFE